MVATTEPIKSLAYRFYIGKEKERGVQNISEKLHSEGLITAHNFTGINPVVRDALILYWSLTD